MYTNIRLLLRSPMGQSDIGVQSGCGPAALSITLTGDKNISILNLSCRTSDLQFSPILQTHALVL